MMSKDDPKVKINNSYETEPSSSGSGSSISECNHYETISDEENINLPYLLKPKMFSHEIAATTTLEVTSMPSSAFKSPFREEKSHELRYGIPVHSSQESSFEGFGDSPFGKLQKLMYEHPKGYIQCATNAKTPDTYDPSPGKKLFPKFYDTVLEENSSNAVDMQLSGETATIQQMGNSVGNSIDSGVNSGVATSQNPNVPSLELSFNGKIKSLTLNSNAAAELFPALPATIASNTTTTGLSTVMETSLNTSQFNESFVLKKYSNEKSPDLFAYDDDDEDENDTENDDSKHQRNKECENMEWQERNPQKPTEIFICDNHIQQPTEDQLDTSNNKSYNCPTESSFADDQTLDVTTSQMHHDVAVISAAANSQHLFRNNCRRERELLRRIRKCLAGIPPPPSLTIPQLDMMNVVLSRKDEVLNFFSDISVPRINVDANSETAFNSILKPTHTLEETKTMPWKDILSVRQHGLSFNLNKASESNEYLGLSVIERFIGAETASSYRNSPSSAKKRNTRIKMLTQSPGNRLSHLAKRRAIFSSANLATTSQRATSLLGPQIMLDKKKSKHRRKATPKRKTPNSKNKLRQTPTSSARKRLFRCDLTKPGPSRETSKRALFQSPAKHHVEKSILPKPLLIKPEIANRVEKSKRALFSPDRLSQSSNSLMASTYTALSNDKISTFNITQLKRKRNAADDDDEASAETIESNKLLRTSAENLTPRALKIKSQSFCIGAGSCSSASTLSFSTFSGNQTATAATSKRLVGLSSSQFCVGGSSSNSLITQRMQRAHSDMTAATQNSLTENQRKKLLWAVSQALQEKKINGKHESFKEYASVLARVVRRIFQEYYQKGSASNSETMLRLAKKYVYNVISGKNVDDIYFHAKAQIVERKLQSNNRPTGYIGPEEYQQRKNALNSQSSMLSSQSSGYMGSMQNLFASVTSIDSLTMAQSVSSQASSTFCATVSDNASQDLLLEKCATITSSSSSYQLPIQENSALQNSSSKNNLAGLALRENLIADSELRRSSAQKNFTGKDQRNLSPYVAMNSATSAIAANTTSTAIGSAIKVPAVPVISELNGNNAKVKRQITFDNL